MATGEVYSLLDSTKVVKLTNPKLSIKDARKAQNPYISYCVAKAESEKAIWQYVKTEKPSYSVAVLLPALIFGPPIQPVTHLKKMNYSTDVFYSLFNGTYEVTPATSFPSYVSFLFFYFSFPLLDVQELI